MQERDSLTYLGTYYVSQLKSLRYELAKNIPGLNLRNVDYFLWKVLNRTDRTVRYKDLDQAERGTLERVIDQGLIENSEPYYSNKKPRKVSENFGLETLSKTEEGALFLGNKWISETHLDRKRLGKLKCYIGLRLEAGLRVHGQRTRSTNRKNKVLKGFQKNRAKQPKMELKVELKNKKKKK